MGAENMANRQVKINIITIKCSHTFCLILTNLIKETAFKLQRQYSNIEVDTTELDSLEQIASIKELKEKRFPAVFVNDVQISAGTLPMEHELLSACLGSNRFN